MNPSIHQVRPGAPTAPTKPPSNERASALFGRGATDCVELRLLLIA